MTATPLTTLRPSISYCSSPSLTTVESQFMCRFVLYSGPPITLDLLTTEPTHSIIHQSYQSRLREVPLNGDGFGIAWYAPEISPQPAQFRSIQPAWNNVNLKHVARVSRSDMILAHVRAATEGLGISESNCHPFVAGPFSFMHNGAVAGFLGFKRSLRESLSDESYMGIHGTTDSEHLFARFRDHIQRGRNPCELARMTEALEATIQDVIEYTKGATIPRSTLNLAVCDGGHAVVSRCATDGGEPPSLYVCQGTRFVCNDGVCRMETGSGDGAAVLIASEPLTDDEAWREVPANHLVMVAKDRSITMRPIAAGLLLKT
ncbi:MAG: class II glutamine amidotransferase [Planctomycetota bacterium]|nr:MAG: class II glutamine amidotransferase [Planctomycetota bacterium]REJ90892.1 MAG: class II glutamine amidotransferase [Planctomycetota bacterium]REK17669.1 MAG: class II glutamine amidotransferase [Planctomycetota bacterium]REK46722.1 MAG: class II glutamine amidotransferase [Planctomycetota bacterium]